MGILISLQRGDTDALDFPFKLDAGTLLDAPADGFTEFFELGCGSAPLVDEEIAVELDAPLA